MTRKHINESKTHAMRLLSEAMPGKNTFDHIMPFVDYLQRQGALLHTRYENQCSYEWACTEAYEGKTDKLEKTLLKNAQEFGLVVTDDVNEKRDGVFIRLQGDPRGWPVELIVNRRTVRLGGKP